MSWTYNSIRMYVQGFNPKDTNIIARLQPLSGGTVLHHFGYEDQKLTLRGKVVTEADKDALEALIQTASSYALVGPEGSIGNYFVKNFNAVRDPTANSIWHDRPSLDCDVPVYTITLELWID